MKSLFTLFFVTLCIGVHAQVTDVITSLDNPTSIALYGDELYVSEPSRIVKFDLTETTPAAEEVLTGFVNGSYLHLRGNELYVADFAGNRIIKLDLSTTDPVPTDVLTNNVYGPNGLAFNGDVMYIAESTEKKISKVDLSQATLQKTDVLTGLDFPNALVLDEQDLYFIEVGGDKISKADLSSSSPSVVTVVSGLTDLSLGLLLVGDELFFSQYSGDKVSKININETSPSVVDVATGLDGPTHLLQKDNDLYVAVRFDDKVSKIEDVLAGTTVTSSMEFNAEVNVSCYPNPVSNMITLTGLDAPESGMIINSKGNKVLDFTAENNEAIDLKTLEAGLYILVLDNGWTQKVIKE